MEVFSGPTGSEEDSIFPPLDLESERAESILVGARELSQESDP